MRLRLRTLSLALCAISACTVVTDDSKGSEDGVPLDLDKADTLRSPTDLGPIASGETVTGTLAPGARYLAWELDTTGDADLSLDTSRVAHAASVDTVMYLYRQGATGWGSYLARNDDAGGSMFSSIEQHVGAGHYRVLVKGYKTTTYGPFRLSYTCSGPGCAAAPACAFGASLGELDPQAFTLSPMIRLTGASPITPLEAAQIVRAMHASSHTDVTTAAEAFAAADQGEIDLQDLIDVDAVRRFTVVTYGAGDNTYGAIFAHDTTTVATEIHDGDFYGCVVAPAVCVFGQTATDYQHDPALTPGTTATYSHASSVPLAVQPEIVAAVRSQRPQVGAIEEVWPLVDGGTVKRVDVTHRDGRAFTIVTYGLGGATYGAAFAKGTTTRVVSITAGATADCTAY